MQFTWYIALRVVIELGDEAVINQSRVVVFGVPDNDDGKIFCSSSHRRKRGKKVEFVCFLLHLF